MQKLAVASLWQPVRGWGCQGLTLRALSRLSWRPLGRLKRLVAGGIGQMLECCCHRLAAMGAVPALGGLMQMGPPPVVRGGLTPTASPAARELLQVIATTD